MKKYPSPFTRFLFWSLLISILLVFSLFLYLHAHKDRSHTLSSKSAHTHKKFSDELPSALAYNKIFAERLGLDSSQAIELDPGIYGIALTSQKNYSVPSSKQDPLMTRYHLDRLSQNDLSEIGTFSQFTSQDAVNDLSILPILFADAATSLRSSNVCSMIIYFKSDDPRLQNALLPTQTLGSNKYKQRYGALDAIFGGFVRYQDKGRMQDKSLKEAHTHFTKKQLIPENLETILDDYREYMQFLEPEILISRSHKKIIADEDDWIFYADHFKNFLPGITALSLEIGCHTLQTIMNADDTWLWMEKNTGKKYNIVGEKPVYDVRDFYQFHLPSIPQPKQIN